MHSNTTNTSRIMFTTAGANEVDAQIVMPTTTYANPSSMRVGLERSGFVLGRNQCTYADVQQHGYCNCPRAVEV